MIENMGKEQKTLPARPVVSVIMNGLNCAQYLQEAIESVFAQTYEDWEIVFWDNASTDSTAEIAKSYGPSVRYFRSDQTYPLGKARNLAIEKARGKYLAFLDSDDIWLPEKLEKQVWAFEKNSAVGLVYCDAIFFNDKGTNYRLYRRKKPPQGKIFRALFKKFYLPLPAVVIKRDALDRINLWFDERFTMVEDADLFMRIAHDYEVAYIDEPLAKWRMHNKSWSNIQKEQFPEELKMMMEKFSALYDNFEENYPKEILLMKSMIDYLYAMNEWERGEKRAVRKRLHPYLRISKRLWIPFICSFLPYDFYIQIKNRCRIIFQ